MERVGGGSVINGATQSSFIRCTHRTNEVKWAEKGFDIIQGFIGILSYSPDLQTSEYDIICKAKQAV